MIGGCASSSAPAPQPAWVDSPASARPASLYLTAVGAGATRAEAHDRALARLAEQLVADVGTRSVVSRDSTLRSRAGGATVASESLDESSVVTVSSRTVLAAASVVEYWREPGAGATVFHALAVLDRERATTFYDDWIAGHEEWVRRQLDAAQDAGPTWRRLQALGSALAHARRRDELARIRDLVAAPGAPELSGPLAPAVETLWNQSADLLRIEVQPFGAAGGMAARCATDGLAALSLRPAEDPGAPLVLRVHANTFRGSTYREGERVALHEYIFEFASALGDDPVATCSFETWRTGADGARIDPRADLFEVDLERVRPQVESLLVDFLNLTPPDIVLLSPAPDRRSQ